MKIGKLVLNCKSRIFKDINVSKNSYMISMVNCSNTKVLLFYVLKQGIDGKVEEGIEERVGHTYEMCTPSWAQIWEMIFFF